MVRLVGPGGAGKTTAGALLARRLGVPFFDLDEEFTRHCGDISLYIDQHGYDAYANRNVGVYVELTAMAAPAAVLALSSGFMTYPPNIHSEYDRCRRDIASSSSTFVLLPSLDLEQCVAETVRRQLARRFARSADREKEVIRRRFSLYADLPRRKIETMRPIEDVIERMAHEIRNTIRLRVA